MVQERFKSDRCGHQYSQVGKERLRGRLMYCLWNRARVLPYTVEVPLLRTVSFVPTKSSSVFSLKLTRLIALIRTLVKVTCWLNPASRQQFQNYPASQQLKWVHPDPAKIFSSHPQYSSYPVFRLDVMPHPAPAKPMLDPFRLILLHHDNEQHQEHMPHMILTAPQESTGPLAGSLVNDQTFGFSPIHTQTSKLESHFHF